MLFGWNNSSAPSSEQQQQRQQSGAAGSVDAIGAHSLLSPGPASMTWAVGSDASWAPLPSAAGSDAGRRPKHPAPFDVKKHDVKARLQDRSTAVVDLVSVVDAPGDVMFDLLADPHQHERIFDAIESANAELVSEEGAVRKWRLDYRARWSFWKVGGVCDNRLWMTTDREAGTVSFALREPGFLRTYEGTWTITGPDGRGPGAAPHRDLAATATSASVAAAPTTTPATATADSSPRRHRLSTGSGAPPSPFAPRSSTDHSATGDEDAAGPYSHALSVSSRNSSFSSIRSSSSGSLDGGSVGSLSGAESPLDRSTRGGGRGGGGLVAGLFAAINNPFFAAPAVPQLTFFRTHDKGAATADPAAAAAGAVATARAATPLPAPRRYPTTIKVRKAISPKISPPYPINQVLKGHASGQVSDMLEGLLAATAKKIALEEQQGD
ncbi:hypothetical protein PLESTB_000753600 [Pleodorina starrii]|uniref:Uncharacterized protein n=1 Tax=Pleodorina starrii TaxID=330485 RepID=A0A9W6F1S0_9CHLO|nr:hypothetical protein PLESTM_001569200 [Pleodorina starrii]GLC53473.1 hypothetical protein PLESTB_000753600 [Pleodorina starrii]GLC69790.1 hypothetical protein PLESTF_000880900 [Pleodorina starrii]